MKGILRLAPLLLGVVITYILIRFCERNTAPVTLTGFSAGDEEAVWTLPTYQLLFGSFAAGAIVAGVLFFIRWMGARWNIHALRKEIGRLRAKYEPGGAEDSGSPSPPNPASR